MASCPPLPLTHRPALRAGLPPALTVAGARGSLSQHACAAPDLDGAAGPFVDSDPADWDRVIAVNLYGVLHTSRAVLPIMAEQGSGAVVNLGSDTGRVGSSGEAVYSAAKGGVIAFTKSLAERWHATRSG